MNVSFETNSTSVRIIPTPVGDLSRTSSVAMAFRANSESEEYKEQGDSSSISVYDSDSSAAREESVLLQVVLNDEPSFVIDRPRGAVDTLVDTLRSSFPTGTRFRLGAKLLEHGRDIGEYIAEHMSVINVLLPLIGGGKGKKTKKPVFNERQVEHYDPAAGSERMSKCALKMALMFANPFDLAVRGVCGIGGSTSIETIKCTASRRVTVSVGTNGFGCIFISPTLANDVVSIWTTGPTFVGSGGDAQLLSANNTLSTGVTTSNFDGLPFATADLVSGSSGNAFPTTGRILGLGVRGMYAGTADLRGGLFVTHRSPMHANESIKQTVAGGVIDFDALIGYEDSSAFERIEKDEIILTDHATSVEERSFPVGDATDLELLYPYSANENNIGGFTYANPNGGVQAGSPTMAIMIKVPLSAAGNSYMFEVIQHCEYSSPNHAGGSGSRTEQDQSGEEVLLNSIRTLDGKRKPRDRWRALRTGLHEALKIAAGIAIPATEAALSAMLMG